ncbi:MAG: ABC transporter substrate-binding protein [Chloroflexi bacterium]|nr:MAG: ABC transporter substrate-binding protein [Chloroflexota bacterium]
MKPTVIAAVAGLLVAACGGSTPAGPTQANGSPITIGVLDDHAASTAVEGAEMQVNTDLAVAQVNAAGGVHGHPLKVVYADPQAAPDQAVSQAQSLVQQQNVDVLMGGVLSSECLGVENLVPRLQVVYLSSTGCAAEAFTSMQCNSYSFRFNATGRQTTIPLATYMVNTYGKHWGIIYPDYALGQSNLAAFKVGLQAAGGDLVSNQTIPIPYPESNMTPYISKIATDGSISGLINSEVSADLVRSSQVISQFGISGKLPVVMFLGKDRFAGVYPDSLTGAVGYLPELSDSPSDNKADIAYHAAFRKQLASEPANIVTTLGGADKAVPGQLGYQAFTGIMALKEAMIASNFTGKANTQALIKSLSTLKMKQGPDAPAGDIVMNASDHQAVQSIYIVKINGQQEQVISTITADKMPPIGNCQVK